MESSMARGWKPKTSSRMETSGSPGLYMSIQKRARGSRTARVNVAVSVSRETVPSPKRMYAVIMPGGDYTGGRGKASAAAVKIGTEARRHAGTEARRHEGRREWI